MARNRKIPIILIDECRAVKTIQFDRKVYLGDPINIAKIFSDLGADEIIYLDISSSRSQREPNYNLIRRIARQCSMPLTYGGGIKTIEQAKRVLSLGVEKISVQSHAFQNDEFLSDLAMEVGVQSVLLSIDVRYSTENENYQIFDRNKNKFIPLEDYFERFRSKDIGEIILANMNKDGMKTGPDLALIRKVRDFVGQPLIYTGGIYSADCCEKAFEYGADAVAASSYFVLKGSDRSILINYPKPSWQI